MQPSPIHTEARCRSGPWSRSSRVRQGVVPLRHRRHSRDRPQCQPAWRRGGGRSRSRKSGGSPSPSDASARSDPSSRRTPQDPGLKIPRVPYAGMTRIRFQGSLPHAGDSQPFWAPRSRRSAARSEEHTSELQSPDHLVCRLLLEKKKIKKQQKLNQKNNNKEYKTNDKRNR